jgi:hypothetical protein
MERDLAFNICKDSRLVNLLKRGAEATYLQRVLDAAMEMKK